jgi:branched-subunit amino acid aminotransferase/4-amino-4-deoxychorismate lyase
MMFDATVRVEVNGRAATADDLRHPALVNYGHFTAMQVRRGRTRGLDLHLTRLDAANRELFDAGLDVARVRGHIRHAVADTPDASVRVNVYWPDRDDSPSVLVAVRPPTDPPSTPQRLMSVPYQRPVPHLKHVGSFGQAYYGRLAERLGFHDALLTAPDGTVSEATVCNVAFYEGGAVVWPDAPCLAGITMQLVEPGLAGAGLPSRRAPVRLDDLPSMTAAFVCNSTGIAPVERVDDTAFAIDAVLMKTVAGVYESVPWDVI